MTDAEQIEAWRNEFQQKCAGMFLNSHAFEGRPFTLHKNGEYFFAHVECAWQGFLMAKRSQPVIELPANCISVENEPPHWINAKRGYDVCLDDVKDSIIAAGYKYKVKT